VRRRDEELSPKASTPSCEPEPILLLRAQFNKGHFTVAYGDLLPDLFAIYGARQEIGADRDMAESAVLSPGRVRTNAFQLRIGFDNTIPPYPSLLIPVEGELNGRPGAAGVGQQPDCDGTGIG